MTKTKSNKKDIDKKYEEIDNKWAKNKIKSKPYNYQFQSLQ